MLTKVFWFHFWLNDEIIKTFQHSQQFMGWTGTVINLSLYFEWLEICFIQLQRTYAKHKTPK